MYNETASVQSFLKLKNNSNGIPIENNFNVNWLPIESLRKVWIGAVSYHIYIMRLHLLKVFWVFSIAYQLNTILLQIECQFTNTWMSQKSLNMHFLIWYIYWDCQFNVNWITQKSLNWSCFMSQHLLKVYCAYWRPIQY